MPILPPSPIAGVAVATIAEEMPVVKGIISHRGSQAPVEVVNVSTIVQILISLCSGCKVCTLVGTKRRDWAAVVVSAPATVMVHCSPCVGIALVPNRQVARWRRRRCAMGLRRCCVSHVAPSIATVLVGIWAVVRHRSRTRSSMGAGELVAKVAAVPAGACIPFNARAERLAVARILAGAQSRSARNLFLPEVVTVCIDTIASAAGVIVPISQG